MKLFRFRSLTVLVISLHLSVSIPMFYILNDGKDQLKLNDLTDVEFSKVEKIVIDFVHPYYIKYIGQNDEYAFPSLPENSTTVTMLLHWSISYHPKMNCTFEAAFGFLCDHVARMVIIEGKELFNKVEFDGYDTYFDNYIGCFENSKLHPAEKIINELFDCISYCKTFFFALTEGKECICINGSREFTPVELHLCKSKCKLKSFQICGGRDYYSIYRIDKNIENNKVISFDPSWECIYMGRNCPLCPEGRYGSRCDNRMCNIQSGKCGEMDCQTYTFHCMDCRCKTCNFSVSLCACRPGFYIYGELTDCIDLDECQEDITVCPGNMSCTNLPGSYSCDCPLGHHLAEGNLCYDIDECLSATCDENEYCTDLVANYSCDCREGFHKTVGSNTCEDIEECLDNIVVCTNNSHCLNTIGGYDCKCNSGFYETPEKHCEDIDECNSTANCDKESTDCQNLMGDYKCLCKVGFDRGESTSLKNICFDIDECKSSYCPDGVSCINLRGSYDCTCPIGTEKNILPHAMECLDVDECLDNRLCDENSSFCMNAFRYYICICRTGYVTVDNYTCALSDKSPETDVIDDDDEEEEEEKTMTTEIFDDNESKSIVQSWIAYTVAVIIFILCGASCLFVIFFRFPNSEKSLSFETADTSELQTAK